MRRLFHITTPLFSLACLLALTTGCAMKKRSASFNSTCAGGAGTAEAAKRYGQTVYPATQKCATCHGAAQTPLFQATDLGNAFQAANIYLQGTPSRLVTQASNGHCGAVCTDHGEIAAAVQAYLGESGAQTCADTSTAPTVIQEWEPNRVTTLAQNLLDLPTDGTSFALRSFTLPQDAAGLNPKVKNVVLSADFRVYQPGYVIMKNLRVLSPDTNLEVTRLFPVVNGTIQKEYKNYADMDRQLRATPFGMAPGASPIIDADSQLFKFASGSSSGAKGDTLALSQNLKDISTDPGPGVVVGHESELEFFSRVIYPILAKIDYRAQPPPVQNPPLSPIFPGTRKCCECHGSAHPTLNLNAGAGPPDSPQVIAAIRAALLAAPGVVNTRNPESSYLIKKPCDPATAHMNTFTFDNDPTPGHYYTWKPLFGVGDSCNQIQTWIQMLPPGS